MSTSLKTRFSGLHPIVVDVETSGLNPNQHAILEVAAIPLKLTDTGLLVPDETLHIHVEPHEGAAVDPKALEVNGIRLGHPFRYAVDEGSAVQQLDALLKDTLKASGCRRAVWVGHNISFDLAFLNALYERTRTKPKHYHSFVSFDTATLSGVMLKETVLAKALRRAQIPFNLDEAHSAIYDAEKTAELFCKLVSAE